MKLTNATIYDIIGAVNKFNNAKGKTAFILFRTLRKLNEEIGRASCRERVSSPV